MTFTEDVVEAILSGKVSDRDALQRLKAELCGKYSLSRTPSNAEILAQVPEEVRERIEPMLRLKPVRSLSGVSVVAVMASPAACPHGRCIYCPGGPEKGTAQSYTGYEPAARRAAANEFDPYRQVRNRLDQLRAVGHPIDKIDMIIMGGTFPARDKEYQRDFVKRCFDALNGVESGTLAEAHLLNETGGSRCIGLTIETRPDQFSDQQIDFLMGLGMTRVELGVQTTKEDILSRLERGHAVGDSVAATERAKKHGIKVCYHVMPGLPGSDIDTDIEVFREIFEDERFRPDMLKIYPTLVIEGTKLYEMWKKGEYTPPDTEYIVDLLVAVKRFVPEWVRIQRIQRDIPVPQIAAGAIKSHARQIASERLRELGLRCRCIRCREIGRMPGLPPIEETRTKEIEYEASNGVEKFIEIEHPESDALIGFARLRIDTDGKIKTFLRELRVYGQQVPIDDRLPDAMQHKGLGRMLLEECERISRDSGSRELRVTSGVGVRDYYRKFGYEFDGRYMSKRFSSSN
ncbi:MAG: tRNA uridine(34) 5-carboxymethylaminomethyl modification radical SAM/GNAT enzyme Elp3 [Thermoplasmata archaeon]